MFLPTKSMMAVAVMPTDCAGGPQSYSATVIQFNGCNLVTIVCVQFDTETKNNDPKSTLSTASEAIQDGCCRHSRSHFNGYNPHHTFVQRLAQGLKRCCRISLVHQIQIHQNQGGSCRHFQTWLFFVSYCYFSANTTYINCK